VAVNGSSGRTFVLPRVGDERRDAPLDLSRFAWLSIAAALVTIALKTSAYLVTGSVGLLSDAAESVVNLVAAIIALIALRVAAKPADANHHYGHGKAEYFSAGAEGLMIFIAAAVILVSAVRRFLNPVPLESVGLGLGITVIASAINAAVAVVLLRAGRTHRSVTLTADGRHLLTDVWTSAGVIVGVLLVALTGWQRLDPLVAAAVGVNILVTGGRLVSQSVISLLDASLPQEDQDRIAAALAGAHGEDVEVLDVRTRVSGRNRFVSVVLLVPGAWTVERAAAVSADLEHAVQKELPGTDVQTSLRPRQGGENSDHA
jgi:cation diffusion facilitator family transporter